MKKIASTVIIAVFSLTAFTQISCSKLIETAYALKDGSIKGNQISKDTLESTIKLSGQTESYIETRSTSDIAHFIFLRTYSKTEAMNKYEELDGLLKKCKPVDQNGYEGERVYSIIISQGLYITVYYVINGNDNPEYTVGLRITHNP